MNRAASLDEANLRFAKVKAGLPAEARNTKDGGVRGNAVTRNPAEMGKILKSVLK
jgi:hypothetical protein